MFELISGGPRHPFHDAAAAPAVLSVVLHATILAAIGLSVIMVTTERMPNVPSIMAFVAAAPPAPPPPPPPAPAAPARAARPKPAIPSGKLASPIEAPPEIGAERGVPDTEETWSLEGGVEGGVIGGVVGGIVGGLVAPLPPPPPPLPQAPPRPTLVRVGGQIVAPALVHRVEPVYPDIAVAAKLSGTVILEATVGIDGAVESVQVIRSIKLLDRAAIAAVEQWRYSPMVLNGLPARFILTVIVSFHVKG